MTENDRPCTFFALIDPLRGFAIVSYGADSVKGRATITVHSMLQSLKIAYVPTGLGDRAGHEWWLFERFEKC